MSDEILSLFRPSRRAALTGAMAMTAIAVAHITSDEAPDIGLAQDDDDFVMIDGWVFRRDDLNR